MHIISRKKLRDFWKENEHSEQPLDNWFRTLNKFSPKSLTELRQTFPSADLYGECLIFNVGGNKFRLITKIFFREQTVLVRFVLTHKEYDKDAWKTDC
jgi:mRNA interferase HigB